MKLKECGHPDEAAGIPFVRKISRSVLVAALSLGLAAASFAQTSESAKTETAFYDSVWNSLTLYKNQDSFLLNEFRIVGRAHFDEYGEDSNLGWDQDWIVRRLRIGGVATFVQNLTLHVEVDLNPQNPGGALYVPSPAYQRLTFASLAWKFSDALTVTVGKHPAQFTLDGGTTSNDLLTIDRNNLSNNLWFTAAFFSGVSLSGKIGAFQYHTGLFSGGSYFEAQSPFEDSSKEFGNFNGSNFWLASAGYDFAGRLGVRKALLRADFVYNPPDSQDNTKNFNAVGSLNFQFDAGRWGFSTDTAIGSGSLGQSDVWGAVVMPWFNITKKLQLAGRYTYISSAEPDGIAFSRYANVQAVNDNANGTVKTNSFRKVSTQRGDEYNEVYLGVNYYLYGNQLKLQTGWNYSWMKDSARNGGDYNGWGWTTGLRVSW